MTQTPASRRPPRILAFAPLVLLAACQTAPSTRSGSLTSYEGLATSNGVQTRSQVRVDKTEVLAARTARIAPTRFADGVGANLSDADRALVANRVDRALCRGLSRRLEVVDPAAPADLSVQATITHLGATNRVAAAGSVVASFVSVVPMMSPRVPYGLGSLTIEAEALDPAGEQDAAIVWSRKAQPIAFMSGATVSQVGDAYQFASAFGGDFSKLVTTGQSPFGKAPSVKLPKLGKKKAEACEAFGSGGGVLSMVSENLGMPPGWTDKGARKAGKPRR